MRIVALLLLALSLVACESAPPPAEPVGRVAVQWAEERNEPVLDINPDVSGSLIRTAAEWERWVASLPQDMVTAKQTELAAVNLSESVAVVATWGRCQEESRVVHLGDGRIDFRIIDPEPRVVCAWSPVRVEVWQISLAGLGVTADRVELIA